ncbi:EAL domain-containing protein [Oxalobacteraceae bacterium A2-2]
MPTSRPLPSMPLAAILTLLSGLALTGLLYSAVCSLERGTLELTFRQRAEQRVAAIRRGLDDTVEVATVVGGLFGSMDTVSRQQFRDFTAPLLARYPFIQAFSRHRVLDHEQAEAHQAAARRELPQYTLHEQFGGEAAPLQPRTPHIIVDYLEPLAGNEPALGLDIAPNPLLRATVEQAVASGQPTATPLLQLAQDRQRQTSFLLLVPLYRSGPAPRDAEARRAAWVGNVAAVIRSTDLVQRILRGAGLHDEEGLRLQVYTGIQLSPANLVYGADSTPPEAPLPRWMGGPDTEPYHASFQAAGKAWQVLATPLPGSYLAQHLGSVSALLGGLLFTLLTTALVHTLAQRSQRVQRLVDARTADLREANAALERDVAARIRAEVALQESEHRFRRLLALSSDWYWEQDAQLRFTHITDGFYQKSRLSPADFIGRRRWDNGGMADTHWGRDHMAVLEARQPFSNFEYALTGADGQLHWFRISGEPVYDRHGVFAGYRGTGAEITERKLAEQRIEHIAHHDVLTGLPNRALLQDRLNQAAAHANRSGRPLWVMLIDLDRFKFVNDSLGHKAGDLLLQTVARRLRESVRDSDTVARLSGDEFVALLTEYPDEQLSPEVTQRVMHAVAQPVMLEGKEFFVTCSIGVAVYAGDGSPAQHLIEHADIAMYRAKKLGRNNTQFYEPAMNEEALERVRIVSALRNALERDELVLHYQPQADVRSGAVVGVEALLRWRHPELGMVAPDRFIGLAEETGLIVPIGAWVLRTACLQARAWQEAGHGPLRVAVNLSPRQFAEAGLADQVAAVLAETGLAPACLDLELTEGLFMNDVGQAVEQLQRLKALGVAISIDDFGTGYSSLSYLRRFPIDVLKIDRSFVSDIAGDEAAIVDSIIALAHNLALKVIAEGVETAAQLDYLRGHGCDEYQGYYLSPALPPEDCAAMFERGSR